MFESYICQSSSKNTTYNSGSSNNSKTLNSDI